MTSNRAFIAAHKQRAAARFNNVSKNTIRLYMPNLAAPSSTSVAINQFEMHAKHYRDRRAVVSERVTKLNDELRSIYKRLLPGIKTAVAEAHDAKAELSAAVEANQSMFVSPRTMTLHGITFGLKKGSGKMTWDCDDDVLVARIEKQFADDAAALDLLIHTEKTASKDALKSLEAKVLAKLGVEVEGTGDVIVIKVTDSEVDKLVKRFMKEGEGDEVEKEGAAASR